MSGDLLVVGPGRLGLQVAGLWRQQQLQAGSIHLQFRSENEKRTRDLEEQGYVVRPSAETSTVRSGSCYETGVLMYTGSWWIVISGIVGISCIADF